MSCDQSTCPCQILGGRDISDILGNRSLFCPAGFAVPRSKRSEPINRMVRKFDVEDISFSPLNSDFFSSTKKMEKKQHFKGF